MIRVLVVEDDRIARLAIESAIGRQSDMSLSGSSGDGETALRMAFEAPHDVILMDEGIPLRSGIEVARAIRRRGVKTPIVFLTADAAVVQRARGIPATEVLLKGATSLRATIDSLRSAVRQELPTDPPKPPPEERAGGG